jgi:hypothetical protein
MNITSPYVVVIAIVVTFLVSILFATSTKEDNHDDHGHASH